MNALRTPCPHRGTSGVITSPVEPDFPELEIALCATCRRFWLERAGWLLSARELAATIAWLAANRARRIAL